MFDQIPVKSKDLFEEIDLQKPVDLMRRPSSRGKQGPTVGVPFSMGASNTRVSGERRDLRFRV